MGNKWGGGGSGGGWGGRKGGLRGIRGGMTPHLGFGVHMLTICAQNLHEPHKSSIFRGVGCWVGCIYSLKLIECFEFSFQKLLGEIEAEFVRNLKGLVDFEVRTLTTKKPRPRSMPRFIDPSFLQQPWKQY